MLCQRPKVAPLFKVTYSKLLKWNSSSIVCTHYTSIPLFLPRFIRLPYLLAKSFLLTIAKHKHFNRFRCTVCKKDFSSNAVLRKHARVHVGDEGGLGNSLQCDLCDYRWLDISVYSSYFYLNTILFQNILLNTNAISHMISTNTKNGLSLHKRSAHKVIVSKDNTNSTSESENYQLECQHCTRFVFLAGITLIWTRERYIIAVPVWSLFAFQTVQESKESEQTSEELYRSVAETVQLYFLI